MGSMIKKSDWLMPERPFNCIYAEIKYLQYGTSNCNGGQKSAIGRSLIRKIERQCCQLIPLIVLQQNVNVVWAHICQREVTN